MSKPPVAWDKSPQARLRGWQVLSQPEDARFPAAAAALLAETSDVATVRRHVSLNGIVGRWSEIEREMKRLGAPEERILLWREIVKRLRPRHPQPARRPSSPRRSNRPSLVAFGGEVRRRRRAEGLAIRGLAERLGTTPAIISRLERGLFNPSLEFLLRLRSVLDWELPLPLFPAAPPPVRVERVDTGLRLTDGQEAIALPAESEDFRAAACGAEMFGHRFYQALHPKQQKVFDEFCCKVKDTGYTLTDAFRLWFYQVHTLREA